ncbi:MAG: DUF5011 domain-containing protein, partial [Bacteroidetes bacterium]|nr:DUF5011 domain-containing protein [Bacteroidota bacterium]
FALFDTGCHDIKLIIWRGGQYDSVVQYCVIYGIYHKLVLLNGKEVDTLDVFNAYVDPGYTAFDNCSGIDYSKSKTIGSVDQNVIGKYILKYVAVNNAGRSDTAIRTVHVVDRIDPVIILLGPDTMYSDKGCHFIDPGVSINDNYYANVMSSTTNNIDSSIIGTYEIKYWAIDGSGNYSDTVSRVIIVLDINPPEFASDTAYVEVYHAYKPDIIFNHYCCSLAESDIYISGNVDTSVLGTYSSKIWIQDCVGNIFDTISQIVIVGDTTPPIVTLAKPIDTMEVYSSFQFEGFTVTDNYCANNTYHFDIKVDTHKIGWSEFDVWAEDCFGNISDIVTQKVWVIDRINPILTWTGPDTFFINQYEKLPPDIDTAMYIWDNYDTALFVIRIGTYFTDYLKNRPAGPIGCWFIIFQATDNSGNKSNEITIWVCTTPSSIEESNPMSDLHIYPNPNNGHFTIENQNPNQAIHSVSVFNQMGQEVYFKEINRSQTGSIVIEIRQPSGIYFIQVKSEKGLNISKILIE